MKKKRNHQPLPSAHLILNKKQDYNQTENITPGGLICLTPAFYEALKKVKGWMQNLSSSKENLASSEIKNAGKSQLQPILLQDYTPPVANTLIPELPAPIEVSVRRSENRQCIEITWKHLSGRNLYLVQVNHEGPENATGWVTNSISMYHRITIDEMNEGKPCWVRICTISNQGRSHWTTLEVNEEITKKSA